MFKRKAVIFLYCYYLCLEEFAFFLSLAYGPYSSWSLCSEGESRSLDSSVVSFLPPALGILRDNTVKSDLTLLNDKFSEQEGDSRPALQA